MNKKELNETINRYYMANEEKKAATAEVSGLKEEITGYLDEHDLQTYTTPEGYTAVVSFRNGTKLNLEKVAELLGGEIPADCYEPTVTPVFTVKAPKVAKAASPKMAVVRAVAPSTAVVAA